MSTPQEILQQMIDQAPENIENIDSSLAQINASIADFQTKQDSMITGVGDVAVTRLNAFLDTIYPAVNHYILYGSTFNLITSSTGTLTDWKIYEIQALVDLTYDTNKTFICEGDVTEIFADDLEVAVLLESGWEITTVASTVYDEEEDETTVTLTDEVLDDTLTAVAIYVYTYNPGDHSEIDSYVSQWEFAQDYILQPLGTSGTYGTQDNIDKLNLAKALLTSNKTKVADSVTVFQEFV